MWDSLPEVIVVEILQRLPVKSLVKCTRVCKSWRSIITNPSFISLHLRSPSSPPPFLLLQLCNELAPPNLIDYSLRHDDPFLTDSHSSLFLPPSFPHPEFSVVGISRGLVCLTAGEHSLTLLICNPCIRRFISLPEPLDYPSLYNASVAFDFDSRNDDFKVVRISCMLDDYSHGLTVPKVGIYSLASGFWRKNLASAPVCTLCFVGRDAPYGFVHGLVHWGAKRRVNNDDPHAWYHFVLSYSFEDEVFGEVLLPETLAHVSSYAVTVTVVGGNGKDLPLTVYRVSGGLPSYGDIWVMKEYGVVGSWTKVFSFDLRGFWLEAPSLGITVTGVTAPPSAMCVRNGGEVLLLMDVAGKGCLYSLDVERKTFTDLGIGGEGYTWYLYSGYYAETLVLLNNNAYGALLAIGSLTPCWYVMVTHMEKCVNLNSESIVSQLQSEIEYSAELLQPMKSSSINLARLLSSALDSTNISFSDIDTKVAPILFQAFVTVPHLTQISYIGMEGLFFSYYNDHDQTLAMYSNSSSSSPSSGGASNKTLYYNQPVNCETGEVYGEAIISNPSINASWIQEAVNLSDGFASFGTKWSNVHDHLFLSSARIARIGVISLGFSAKAITDFVTCINPQGTSSYLATKDGKVLVEGIQHVRLVVSNDTVSFQSVNANGNAIRNEGTVSCKDEAVASSLNIQDAEYLIHCYPIDIMGIQSVYVLAVPRNGFVSFDLNYKKKGLALFIVTTVMILVAAFSFLFINARATRREMHLCASLITQKEATHQAERKNMNKSLAFASASHDVRTSLAGLTALIEISSELVDRGSELETRLTEMEECTQDLLGLLNSILDTSKIEVGKMQLKEEEFDVSHILEDVVDLYHLVAMKKGVDLVLDPCNGSVIKYSRVKGDKGKLKQVLCNLLNNAVKFTNEGHITVRAWAQKPPLHGSIIKINQLSFMEHLSCLFYKKNKAHEDLEKAMNSIQQDPHYMDFVFEVDDTGKGIPKENYMSVFENYVQVKETAIGQEGTGLGLGIVQSLVRLMHGDIGIVDKDIGEKGTCFRFNVLLTLCESETVMNGSTREDLEYGSGDRNQRQGRTIHTTSFGSNVCFMSPRLHMCSSSSPRPEASRVVLLIGDKERRRTCQRFMERIGIKVKIVKCWEHLFDTLEKIKQKGRCHYSYGHSSPLSSNLSSESTSHNDNSFGRARRGVPLSAMDHGTEYIPSVFKKTSIGAAPGFILIVIDANAGPFSELRRIVSNFKKDLHNPNRCNVVWLDKPHIHSINSKTIDENDIVISKPFHGSRLFQVIMLLPEYGGGAWQSSTKRESSHDDRAGKTFSSRDSSLSKYQSPRWMDRSEVSPSDESPCLSTEQKSDVRKSPVHVHHGEIQECGDHSSCYKPLCGKKILVVEDNEMLRKTALATLIPLGASIEQCENGEQAVRLVHEGLTKDFPNPPYDYILMDCMMPVMDGCEATRRIRVMEKPHGVHIPIIALTADTDRTMTLTGMDFHIEKPLRREHLLEAIQYLHRKD